MNLSQLPPLEAIWPQLQALLGPVAKGALTQYHRHCGKAGCQRCANGGPGHLSFNFLYYQDGVRQTRYVSPANAPRLRAAIERGRRLEALLTQAGTAYLDELEGKGAAGRK